MARAAANRLSAAVERQHTQQQQSNAGAKSKAKKTGKGKPAQQAPSSGKMQSIFDEPWGSFGAEVASRTVESPLGEAGTDIFNLPLIIRVDPGTPDYGAESAIATICNAFALRFAKAPERNDPGRAQRKASSDKWEAVQALFMAMYPEGHHIDIRKLKEEDTLREDLFPSLFGIAKSRETCGVEPGFLGSTRLLLKGTRKCVLIPIDAAWAYLESVLKCAPVSVKKIRTWVQGASADNFNALQAANKESVVLRATVGPHDALHVPPGWLFSRGSWAWMALGSGGLTLPVPMWIECRG